MHERRFGSETNQERELRISTLQSLLANRLSKLINRRHFDEQPGFPLMIIDSFIAENPPHKPKGWSEKGENLDYFISRCSILKKEFYQGSKMSVFYGIAYELINHSRKKMIVPEFVAKYRRKLINKSFSPDQKHSINKYELLWLSVIDVLESKRNNFQGKDKNSVENSL